MKIEIDSKNKTMVVIEATAGELIGFLESYIVDEEWEEYKVISKEACPLSVYPSYPNFYTHGVIIS